MAKLTQQDISELKIIRANFITKSWRVLFSNSDNTKIYVADFEGLETDTDDDILINSHIALLEVDKQEEPIEQVVIERPDLAGQSPKEN